METTLETTVAEEIIEQVRTLSLAEKREVLAFLETLNGAKNGTNGAKQTEAKPERTEAEKRESRRKLIGMFSSGHTDTSERVDEILADGINKREGWSLP